MDNTLSISLHHQTKIHLVISIEHLEPHPATEDPYGRKPDVEPVMPAYSVEGDWVQMSHVLGSRRVGRTKRLEYLLRRHNLGPAWDVWRIASEVEIHTPSPID